jgi:N-acetylmuramoyl-L-alanine amidase
MKLAFWQRFIVLTILGFSISNFGSPARAVQFDQQEVDQSRFIVVAAPGGEIGYKLLIIEQLNNKRPCWSETGGNPSDVEPLLVNFDFTGICNRIVDSNGFSLRAGGVDQGLQYSLRILREGDDLVLVAASNNDRNTQIEIGRTHGLPTGFSRIVLDPGWRLTRRVFNGRAVGHVYLTYDQPVEVLVASAHNNAGGQAFTAPITQPPTENSFSNGNASNGAVPDSTIPGGLVPVPVSPPSVLSPPPSNPSPDSGTTPEAAPPSRVSTSPILPPPAVSPSTSPSTPSTELPSSESQPAGPIPDQASNGAANSATSNSTANNNTASTPSTPPSTATPNTPTPNTSNRSPLTLSSLGINRSSNSSSVSPPVNSPSEPQSPAAPNIPPAGSNSATAANPQLAQAETYQVIVIADSAETQDKVRNVAPNAFLTTINGQVVMQVGVFRDRQEADRLQQRLSLQGLPTAVIPVR